MNYDKVLTEVHGEGPLRTGLITLNRPKQLNALSDALMDDLGAALNAYDAAPLIYTLLLIFLGHRRAWASR
jgi:enoyl-CoA hydratase